MSEVDVDAFCDAERQHIKEGIVSPPSFHHRRGTKGRSVRLGRRAWLVPGARPVREGRKASVAYLATKGLPALRGCRGPVETVARPG